MTSTCLESLEMSGNLIAVREMSGILLKVREISGKNDLKQFIVTCIFASILDFADHHFWHATHDCVEPYVDIILHRGRF